LSEVYPGMRIMSQEEIDEMKEELGKEEKE
jgi:hypothetical protein